MENIAIIGGNFDIYTLLDKDVLNVSMWRTF